MADSGEIPHKLSHGIRLAVFWIALPFIGLLVGIERIFDEHGNRYQVMTCVAGALLSIAVAVYWDRLIPPRWRAKPLSELGYLHAEDAELGSAIREMVWCSASPGSIGEQEPEAMGIGFAAVRAVPALARHVVAQIGSNQRSEEGH
jgi:hypothetical protein